MFSVFPQTRPIFSYQAGSFTECGSLKIQLGWLASKLQGLTLLRLPLQYWDHRYVIITCMWIPEIEIRFSYFHSHHFTDESVISQVPIHSSYLLLLVYVYASTYCICVGQRIALESGSLLLLLHGFPGVCMASNFTAKSSRCPPFLL